MEGWSKRSVAAARGGGSSALPVKAEAGTIPGAEVRVPLWGPAVGGAIPNPEPRTRNQAGLALRFSALGLRPSGRRWLGVALLLAGWAGWVWAGSLSFPPGEGRDAGGPGPASSPLAAFDQANRLYEKGQFTNAAAAYQQLIDAGHGSVTLWFNLGNAWFKAGQPGRAIAAWRQAEKLAPRDPYVRFNLQFARKQVTGSDAPNRPLWQRFLGALTLDEWTLLACAGWWLWFGLLAAREARPALRPTLRGWTTTAGVAALALAVCLGAALRQQAAARTAVVVVPSAVVRHGPLDESQVAYQLRDGSEVTVLDEKAVSDREVWLQVRDEAGRRGWLKRDQVLLPGTGRGSG